MGQAGRAASDSIDAQYLNPAALPFGKSYNFGFVYQSERAALENPVNRYAIVVTDNSGENGVTGGAGYLYRRSSFPNKTIVDQDFSLSFAGKLRTNWSIGIQGRRWFRQDNQGPNWTKHNIALGTMVVPADYLSFAFVAYDVLKDDDLDMIPVLALGSHFIIMDIIRLRADVSRQEKRNPNHEGVLNLGMEINAQEGFLFRVGGIWDELQKKRFFTAGLGWEGPRLSVAYAYRKNVDLTDDTVHTFQAWLAF